MSARGRRGTRIAGLFLLLALPFGTPAPGQAMQLLDFTDLPGWAAEDHAAALRVFAESCDRIRPAAGPEADSWRALCAEARVTPRISARRFFEARFRPVVDDTPAEALFTGYYEPELEGSRSRQGAFRYPIYAPPADLPARRPWLTRAEIDAGALAGQGLELVWLRDPVEAFFLHVQGSGRVRLRDGDTIRLGFAARNNHPYRSVGKYMIANGLNAGGNYSAEGIASWIRARPERVSVLAENPSYIFFRELGIPADKGPVGALGVPLTPRRSLAVDPAHVTLGAPVWIETETRDGALNRLMVAQDTGSAIKGAQRGDIFFGWGDAAYGPASVQYGGGRLVRLVPRMLDVAEAR